MCVDKPDGIEEAGHDQRRSVVVGPSGFVGGLKLGECAVLSFRCRQSFVRSRYNGCEHRQGVYVMWFVRVRFGGSGGVCMDNGDHHIAHSAQAAPTRRDKVTMTWRSINPGLPAQPLRVSTLDMTINRLYSR
jgi:hypothetical protein